MSHAHYSEADRRDALHARNPDRYHFEDEEPERRSIEPPPVRHRHSVDGYCAEAGCHQWMPAD